MHDAYMYDACIVSYCIVLHCIVLYCTVLYNATCLMHVFLNKSPNSYFSDVNTLLLDGLCGSHSGNFRTLSDTFRASSAPPAAFV